MITPVIKLAEHCNLSCTYCYQSERLQSGPRMMTEETLQRILEELDAIRQGSVSVLWYGGEPTVVGKRRFRKAVLRADGVFGQDQVAHYLQTNGVLIDEEWADFLQARRFKVTVSLDGPEELHNLQRPRRNGRESHGASVRCVQVLRSRGVPVRVSCVVTPATLAHADSILEYFSGLDIVDVDFPPALLFRQGRSLPLVDPQEYGRFMARVFERWMELGPQAPRVRSLAGIMRALAGRQPGFCKLEGRCTRYLTFGSDGSVFPCDEFSGLPEYRLGNVHEAGLREILGSSRARERWASWHQLPEACAACRFSRVCRGGCPFERQMAGGVDRPSLLCAGLQVLYQTIERQLSAVTTTLC